MKAKFVHGALASFLFLFISTFLAAGQSCEPPPSGIVSWWPGEGNADDIIGNNNGILDNGVTFTDGVVGEAFHFNGSNQDVQIPYSTSLEPTNITVECWVKLDALASPVAEYPGLQYIVFKQNSRSGDFEGYDLEKNRINGQDVFRFQVTSVDGEQVPAASTTIPQPGVWYHLAGTYDGTTVKIYVNGVLEGTAVAGFPMDYGTEPVYFGTTGQAFDGRLEGALDEVSIYNRALSPAEVSLIYLAGSNGKCHPENPSIGIPVITSFSPALGATGTVVNISGIDFSPIAASNTVYFGAVQASVSSATQTNLLVTVPAGATFAPITETVNGMTAYAQTPFLPTFPGTSALSANTFAPSFNLGAGDGPVRVIAADVDGDGKPDLIVADDYGDDVLIYRNISANGTLSPNSFAPPVELPVGPVVSQNDAILGLAVGDLSGDGRLDIVVANRYTSEISIFQNLSSPGVLTSNSFGARIDIPVAGNPSAVAVMDMDGDGEPDLLTANYNSSSVSVLRNTSNEGDLLTTNSFAPPISFSTGSAPYSLAVGDLDGDGKPDVITGAASSGSLSNTISVLRNISTVGNIVLQSNQDFAGLGQANSMAIGDLDGDGKPDVVVSSGSSGQAISVYRNTSTPGAVTLAAPVSFPIGGWGNTIAIGDMDGDGKPDIAVETQLPNQICLFRNISTPGSFTTGSLAPMIVLPSGYNPNGIVIADLLGDGRPDLVFANTYDGTLTLEQNMSAFGEGTPPFITIQPTNETVLTEGTATFGVTAGGTTPLTYQWFYDGTGINGATNPILTLNNVQPGEAGNYYVTVANVYGSTNSATATLTVSSSSSTRIPAITGFNPTLGATGTVVNVSGLNFSPIAASNTVYFGAVQAVVKSATPTSLTVTVPVGATFAPITETVNGLTAYSKKPFVPTFSGVATNFSLGPQLVLPAGSSPAGVVIADLDGDGKPDLAINNGNSHTIEIYRNISTSGSLTASSFAPPVILPIGTGGQNAMVAADLTGDGKLDLVCPDENSNIIVVIKNLCTPGNITSNSFAPGVTFAVGTDPRGVAVQDLDGDGKPEIVVPNCGDSTVSVFRNTSTPGIINSVSFAPPVVFPTGLRPQNVMVADIDGDGQPDLVTVNNNYYNNSSGMSVLRNISTPGNIAFENHVDFPGRQDTYCLAIGDLDGDGKPDVVIGSQGGNGPDGNAVSIYRNTSTPGSITTNSFAPEVDIAAGGWINSVALADLNGDGKLDIAAAMQIPSQMEVLINTSTPGSISNNSFASPLVFASGWNANGIAVGDLNGDGLPDIAFANSYDGTISVYQNLTELIPTSHITTTLDHFAWNPIPSPRFRDTLFEVQITALDTNNAIVTNYIGRVHITTTNGIPVHPPVSGEFVLGAWTGNLLFSQTGTNLVLYASDDSGHVGFANPINVVSRPMLRPSPNGGTLQFTWPAGTPGFILEMTTNLASGYWVPVPGQPVLSGDQYIQQIPQGTPSSGVFYRLYFTGQ